MRRLATWFPAGGLGCFYCGVDSTPLLIFFVALVGSLALGTLFTAVGLWLRGSFKETEGLKDAVLKLEEET